MEDGEEHDNASFNSSPASSPLFASSRESSPDLLELASDNDQYSTASTSPPTDSTCSSVSRPFLRSPRIPDSSGSGAQADNDGAAAGPSDPEVGQLLSRHLLARHPSLTPPPARRDRDTGDSSDEEAHDVLRPPRRRRSSEEDPRYNDSPRCPKPVHKWSALFEFNRFQAGGKALTYRRKCYGNLFMVQRLELMAKLDGHSGCVNSVNFNDAGDLLVSGSDDLHCMMWEWQSNKLLASFGTSHRCNIFQSKFMPHKDNQIIITSSRDGSIRLHQLDEAASRNVDSRKIGYHRGPVHKIAMHPALPETILTSGEDGVVSNIDIRLPNHVNLLTVRCSRQSIVGLYSIAINPLRPSEFVTAGKDQFVRIFDTRNAKPNQSIRELCPDHLKRSENSSMSVSCAVYNFDGTEVLATYSDEDIYIFPNDVSTIDAEKPAKSYLQRYRGHRNSDTVKSVNYFGQRSEYVVSGSDCGHIFFWDKKTEHIVNFLYGDDESAVNTVEPNPCAPFLATSGFDHNVKIWAPSADEEPNLDELRDHTIQTMRQRDVVYDGTPEHGRMLLYMMNLIPEMPGDVQRVLRSTDSSSDDDSPDPYSDNDTPDPLQQCSTS